MLQLLNYLSARGPQVLKPVSLQPVLRSKANHRSEKPVLGNEEEPTLAAARESPSAAAKSHHNQKKKILKMYSAAFLAPGLTTVK